MNGAKKFHSADGPAFNAGEVWKAGRGAGVTIIRTERYGVDKWDVDVYYLQSDGTENHKNAWSFQVRYQHEADKEL
jgi:hypothetical protein